LALKIKFMIKHCLILVVFAAITGCKLQCNEQAAPKSSVVRYGMVTGVKPDKLSYYKELHAKPWPAVIAKIKECNIENYSIYLQRIDDKFFLFSYFEYTGNDFDKDMKKMAADTTTQRWWRETDPCQIPLPEAAANKQIWTRMEEVFHAK